MRSDYRISASGEENPGKDVLAVERVVLAQELDRSVGAIHDASATHGVDDPDEPRAGSEPIADFALDFACSVPWRQYFDDKVGGQMVASRFGSRNSIACQKCRVGPPARCPVWRRA